jgi:hypothetical protein
MIVDPPDAVREGRAVTGLVPERAIETLKRITDLARARGIRTIGCTLGPLQSVTSKEEDSFVYTTGRAKLPLDPARAAINEWIRSSGAFDSVADFDAVLRDPARPSRVKEELSLYDYSNSSFSGQPVPGMRQRLNKAMADAIDLSFFAR